MTMTTQINVHEIVSKLNDSGYRYYGDAAKGWDGHNESRVYFGREWVTIDQQTGEIHNRRATKARALTIGQSAVDAVETMPNRLATRPANTAQFARLLCR